MSRTDEILDVWRVAAASVAPPSVAPRAATTRSLVPVGTLAMAALVVVAVVGIASGRLLGNPAGTFAPSPATMSVTIPLVPGHSLTVAIRDGSGSLVSARAATSEELATTPGGPPSTVTAFTASGLPSTELTLVWAGGICDTTAELDISSDLHSIAVAPGPAGQPCDSVYVGRGLVLTFGSAVDARDVRLTMLSLPSSSLTPTVDASPISSGGISRERAIALAAEHVSAAVFVAAKAGPFTAVNDDPNLGPGGYPSPPDRWVWAITFRREITICPQYVAPSAGATPVAEPTCWPPRTANSTVILDYFTGAFLLSGTYAPSGSSASSAPSASPSSSETPSAADVAAAADAAGIYTNHLVAGEYAAAWAMLGPEYQAQRTLAEYSTERAAFFRSVAGRFHVTPQPPDVAPIGDWLAATNGASIDLRHAVLVEVSYPALAGNNAGFELFIVAPTPAGLRLYPVR